MNPSPVRSRTTQRADHKPSSFPPLHRRRFLYLAFVLLLVPFTGLYALARDNPRLQEDDTFVFAAGGDIGANRRSDVSLRAIPGTGASFFLAIGDLDYDETSSDAAWCDYVKERVGSNYPFQLVTGNHEEGSASNPGRDGYVGNHAACLPDHFNSTPLIDGMPGYPANYYFDYPQDDPMLRVIMISAALEFDGVIYQFNRQEQTNYNALAAAIDEAKQNGLWVVVGIHKVCLTAGEKSCEIGADLVNLLLEKRVDLVLQGHDHNYQRSKQIRLGDGCTGIVPRAYNPNCIADDGSDNTYTRGEGTVFVIDGVVGRCCYTVNPDDEEAGYFSTLVGNDDIDTYGFVTYTVSRTRIDAQVVASVGTWSDHFSLVQSGSPPPPTLTPIPTDPPSVTPDAPSMWTFVPVADSYVRSTASSANYGKQSMLRTDGSPEVHSYLRFDVQGVEGGITSATLRIYANSLSNRGFSVRHVADNTWDETTITYETAPAFDTLVGETAGFGAGTWVDIDVTPLIQGNGLVSFALTAKSATAISYSSREGSNPPQLIVNATLPEVTEPQLPESTALPTAEATLLVPSETPEVVRVPFYETMDDGALRWSKTGEWHVIADPQNPTDMLLQSGTQQTVSTLTYLHPISLQDSASPQLVFESRYQEHSGTALVQLSSDGNNWYPMTIIPPSDDWTTVALDLSAYTGQVIYIQFVWQVSDAPSEQLSPWQLDDVRMVNVDPTVESTNTATPDVFITVSPQPAVTDEPTLVQPSETAVQTATESEIPQLPEVTLPPIEVPEITPPTEAPEVIPTETTVAEDEPEVDEVQPREEPLAEVTEPAVTEQTGS